MKKANRIIEIIFYVAAACSLVYAFMATSSAITQYQQAALYMGDQLDFGTVLGFFLGQLVPSYFYAFVLFALGWIIGGNISASSKEEKLPKIPDQREEKKEEPAKKAVQEPEEAKDASEISVSEAIMEEEAPESVLKEDEKEAPASGEKEDEEEK